MEVYTYNLVKFTAFLVVILILNSCKKKEAELPTITTIAASQISHNEAISGGNINNDGGANVISRGSVWSMEQSPSFESNQGFTIDGSGVGVYSSTLTELTAGSTYHVRAYATNSVGTAYGADLSFSTLGQAPLCETQPASNISTTAATLNGNVNAYNSSTIVTFEYGTTTSYGQTITATQSPVTGNTMTNVSANISGLTLGITYHFRVKTVNGLGTVFGSDLSFETLGQSASSVAQSATNVSTTAATLNGTVNANNSSTTVTFEYGTSTNYGSTAIATQSPVTGSSVTNVNVNILGLAAGTTYHFRIKTVNSGGIVYSNDLTFITLGSAPLGITQAPTNISTTGATLNGTVNANYLSTTVTFEYGTNIDYGSTAIATQSPVSGNNITNVNVNISGLSLGTIYHYRIKAVNTIGTTYGSDLIFTTVNFPTLITTAINNVTINSAYSGGNIISDGGSPVTARGICWSTSINPTNALSTKTIDGSGTGTFVSSFTGLLSNTTYYVRAYATNIAGTSYGDEISFTTAPGIDDLLTGGSTSINGKTWVLSTVATTGADGGGPITSEMLLSVTLPDNFLGLFGLGTEYDNEFTFYYNGDYRMNPKNGNVLAGAVYGISTGTIVGEPAWDIGMCAATFTPPVDATWTIHTESLTVDAITDPNTQDVPPIHSPVTFTEKKWISISTGAYFGILDFSTTTKFIIRDITPTKMNVALFLCGYTYGTNIDDKMLPTHMIYLTFIPKVK
jgi:hypothetical protein